MGQVVECLPTKHRSLSSNPSTTTTKKEKKESEKVRAILLGTMPSIQAAGACYQCIAVTN
jgi:hypothetical protein